MGILRWWRWHYLPRTLELNGVFRGLFPIDAERDASERIGLIKEYLDATYQSRPSYC
jgi:hypothetical protein